MFAVLALVVVNALRDSPWGLFTIACTVPIALLMGFWMKVWRPGRVLEASLVGVILLIAALLAGQWIAGHPTLGPAFTWRGTSLAWAIIAYGFVASVLPVWMLLCPRDYLSTYMKAGTIALLAFGVIFMAPVIQMPAVTKFAAGGGPVIPGTLFPFLFITIACGAVSGFHALVASGTTPKMVSRESELRAIGFGAMLVEGFVSIMALVAAARPALEKTSVYPVPMRLSLSSSSTMHANPRSWIRRSRVGGVSFTSDSRARAVMIACRNWSWTASCLRRS